ncbi:hypothetical protein LDVICp097 [lymphocystis disease virus-China]|uniref:Uncharacterized protein n=2 Tax=Lymphocystis disease virus 2 TaxID=159183 RepID=A0A6F8WZP3_9VIRU|nr:hypothetical protein LDVICp097 [lymphocystis disease virus-China]AAU10942.1 hypothetical protein [lymphocystis disease virus-China]BCB67467.1 hypothetical protein [Lymphocystis disease virus 2]
MLKHILLFVNILYCLAFEGIINLDNDLSGSGSGEEEYYDWQHCSCWQSNDELTTVKVPILVTITPNGTKTTTVAGSPITTVASPTTTEQYYDYNHCLCVGQEEESSGFSGELIAISQKPATTTQKPATTTQKPATTTQKPATTTQKPATTTQKPATTKQPVTTQEPSTTPQGPVTAKQRTTQMPGIVKQHITQKPTTTYSPVVNKDDKFTTSLTIGQVLTTVPGLIQTPSKDGDDKFKFNQVMSKSQSVSMTNLSMILCSIIYLSLIKIF